MMLLYDLRMIDEAARLKDNEIDGFIDSMESSTLPLDKLVYNGAPVLSKALRDSKRSFDDKEYLKSIKRALRLAKKLKTVVKKIDKDALSTTNWRRLTAAWWPNIVSISRGMYTYSDNTKITSLNRKCTTKDEAIGRYDVCIATLTGLIQKHENDKNKSREVKEQ